MPWSRSRSALLAALAAGGLSVCLASVLFAGLTGSPHDFSATKPSGYNHNSTQLAPGGACSGCHIPHAALDNVLWRRSLSDYRTRLFQRDGSPSTELNFLIGSTIQCYDCHDLHTGGIETPSNPSEGLFDTNHRPQNILSGFRKNSLGSMTEDGFGTESTLKIPGYYETNPLGAAANYGVNLTAPLAETGGHNFKQDPTTSGNDTYDSGDKLPCRDCHDPHAWDSGGNWQAFFRKVWPSGSPAATRLGTTAVASSYMANDSTPSNRRSDLSSRTLCIACHGNSDTLTSVNFPQIQTEYTNNAPIIRPPATIGEHANASQEACITCHVHNSIGANCSQCHGFPPNPYPPDRRATPTGGPPLPVVTYSSRDPHPQHVGRADGQAPNTFSIYGFDCKFCHATSALGSRTTNVHQDNIINLAYDFSSLGVANPPDNTSSGTRICSNVYCHSNGGLDNTMGGAGNYFRSPQWGVTAAPMRCNGCHGPGTPDNVVQTGMPSYASGAPGSATANSHAVHVVTNRYDCAICHDATAQGAWAAGRSVKSAPLRHVNGIREVVFGGGVTGTYDNTAGQKRCSVAVCHGSGTPQWGGTLPGCSACHLSGNPDTDHYLTPIDNLYAGGIRGNIDNTEWGWSGHGRSAGNYDVSLHPAANLLQGGDGSGDACAFCHDKTVGHDNATNPFRLKDQVGAASYLAAKGWNATCLVCHFHSTSPTPDTPVGYDPDGGGPVYLAKAATASFVDNAHYGAEHSATYNGGLFCWDCHDPHGDRPNGSTNNIFMIQGGSARTGSAQGPLARQTRGTQGILGAAGVLTTNAPIFTAASTGTDYADNTAPMQGICQVCHTQATTGHYRESLYDGHNQGTRCTQCHLHNAAFAGTGGPDIEQYFDRSYNNPGSVSGQYNYNDNSSHPLTNTTTGSMTFSAPMENCLACHGAAYKSSGTVHYSNECVKCHFEHNGGPSLGTNHLNRTIELSTPSNAIPATRYTINTLTDYDNWCLECHRSGATVSLNGIVPSGRTVIGTAAFANGRHRVNTTGCIHCHQPHGRGNARIVRENPANRRAAGSLPMTFGVYPTDNTGGYGSPANQNIPYRARFDNTAPNVFADADDDNNFCNRACHNPSYPKDKVIRRDNTTGNYLLSSANKKVYLVNGVEYTNDNTTTYIHGHANDEIISTDPMVQYYAGLIGLSGPSYYRYPGQGDANPTTFNNPSSPLPFFPDFQDGTRDFTNGYNGTGWHIRYRYTCSSCHNPHGTALPNTPGFDGYPDLRLRKANPQDLCRECHR